MHQLEKSIGTFEEMATAISERYLANVSKMAAQKGARPDFDELMVQLKLMEQELTKSGIQFIEEYKAKHILYTDEVTTGLKGVIRNTIEGFIKQL